jgi:NAD(P)-dependent dehydrogenase (short-subunit alcohol dehydrogenase family)
MYSLMFFRSAAPTSGGDVGRLRNKVAVITGSASGIGRAAAELFAREGATVAVVDIDADGGAATARAISDTGGQADFFACDITDAESVQRTMTGVKDAFGRIDVLYNNAGGSQTSDIGTVLDLDLDHWWDPFRFDLFGTFACCRFAIPHLLETGGGAIVNTTSAVAMRPQPGLTSYSAAKGGVIVLTRELAAQFGTQGLRVNAVAPSHTRTARIERRPVAKDEEIGARHLLGPNEPIDVASAALFLASDEARQITGVILPVDSGYTL